MSNRLQLTQLAASIALVAGSAAFVSSAHAAAPAAGTNISNVASATYTDSTGNSKTVSSNIVTTTVLPVASFTLEANRTATANNNSLVSLSHTLTNTGNATDTFTLSLNNVANKPAAGGDDYDFTGLKIYLDANGDGAPDSTTPITSITLDAGKSVNLIVQGTTDATAAVDKLGQWIVGATSTNTTLAGAALTVTNTDTVKITNGAVIKVNKSASVSNIDATKATKADRIVTYTLEYQNIGNSIANGLKLTDVLDAKLEYEPGSAKLLGTAQTDAADGDGYVFDTASNTLTLTISSLAPNNKGTLTFQAVVKQGTDVGAIDNTANSQIGTNPSEPSNTNYVNVIAVPKGTINDSASDAYSDAEAVAGNTAKDNQIIINEINQGEVAVFGGAVTEKIIIHNTGNVAQEFNVSATNITVNLPGGGTGTGIVTLYNADGASPFVSTGSIAKGGSYELVAKITLPATYSGNTPLTATLITSPKSDSTKTDTLNLVINNVKAATVDLHNGDVTDSTGTVSGATGKDTGQFIDTKSVLPGQPATFPLQVDNKSTVNADNYNLTANIPAGWDVKFYIADTTDAANWKPTGSPITNTGNINQNSNVKLVAVVTPSAGATAKDEEVLFTVTSPATSLSDTMSDKVTVQSDRKMVLNQDRIGQVAPGGTVVYKHTLTNNSNLVEGETAAGIPFSLTSSNPNWTANLYIDNNNDGLIDSNDTLVTGSALTISGGIAKGSSVNLLVKVQAPIDATVNTQNPVVLTFSPVDYNGISHVPLKNTDLTTVTAGQVRLVKDQAVVNCTTGTGGTYAQTTVSAKPGECVKYRITAINEGNATVTNVVISDTTPQYTTLAAIAGVSPKATDATLGGISSNGSTGTITATQPSLEATKKAELEFVIKVNPLTP
ncbi:beta strand repeat-containing protein [Acinetobacter lwoffii]|uniref:beta strand repeat-containing protein n=1 Tax=Acinetobacter lwoffii TaxID=28090 RepID=UPI00209AB2B3|nr:hypothetical protein [Acinetobacter lwoffii]MCO8094532.1 hypothetical protein [Acinetobacter lwoffii]MEB6680915.1 hypothetical protein [Acinetobacter lwoffii]